MKDDLELEGAGPGALAGRSVVVLGLGLFGGGLGAARWALKRGALVTVTDLRSEAELRPSLDALDEIARGLPAAALTKTIGRHEDAELAGADLVIVNPAVPPHAPPLRVARAAGARITTATAILLRAARCRVIGVTGTHGKSSTARFLASLLGAAPTSAGARVVLGGNIGGSLLGEIESLQAGDTAVLELSSYQLEHLPEDLGRPLTGAIITHLGIDHLARHGTVERYRAAKHRLLDLIAPGGFIALDSSVDAGLAAQRAPGVRVDVRADSGSIALHADSGEVELDGEVLGSVHELQAAGAFQAHNLALALAAGRRAGAEPGALARAVPSLSPPPHRLEPLGHHRAPSGARFDVWDNGVSTTPESTVAALESIEAEGAKVVLVGGQAKGELDLAQVTRFAAQSGWTVVGFGASGGLLESGAADRPLEDAVRRAIGCVSDGGALVFSPACASFDAFANFQGRARAFRAALGQHATACDTSPGAPRD